LIYAGVEFLKNVGFNIKVKRMRQKMSQEKLAELSDCSLSYIGFIERGEKSLSLFNFIKIINALKLEPNKFWDEYINN